MACRKPVNDQYQPLKWQTEYNHRPAGSPAPQSPITLSSPGLGSRSSIPHSSSKSSLISKKSSGVNLDTIPEDHFLDRGRDFRFVGGIRNPAFEMSDFSIPIRSQNRRFSEGDLLDRDHQRSYNRNDNSPYREQKLPPNSNGYQMDDPRQDRRKSVRDIRNELRIDTRSDVSVGGRSVRSGRSESGVSEQSADTKLNNTTSSRNASRRSESGQKSGERRPSGVPSRRSAESARSSNSNSNNKSEASVLTVSPIEIPIEFLETPATRIKKLFGPVIMCVLVITLAGSLGAAIYFATVLKEAQEQTIDVLKAQLEMATSGIDVQTLNYREKLTFKEDYCKQMDEFYQQSSMFQKTYKKCTVDSLTNSKIKFTLYFEDEEDQATSENIIDVLKAKATGGESSKQVEVNQLKLDLDTVKVTLEKTKVEETPSSETTSRVSSTTSRTPPASTTPSPRTSPPPTPPPLNHLPSAQVLTEGPVKVSSTTTKSSESQTSLQVTKSTTLTQTTLTTPKPPPTSSQPPDNRCANNSGKYFQHHRECNLYIQCHDGASVTFACPETTVFDIKQKVCVTKTDDVICPEKPPTAGYDWSARDPWDPCRNAKGDQYFPYPEDCNLFFQCQHNKSIVRLCPKDSIFDNVNKNCVPASPDIICYTITTAATAAKTEDARSVTAVHDKQTGSTTTLPPVVYPSRPDYSPTPCKEGINGGLYPHPSNCSMYILCEYTNERIRSCAVDLYFDPNIKTCIRPKNDLLCPDIRPCDGLNSGLFPHPKVCNEFITCNGGQEVIQKCMNNDVWNPRTNTCVLKTDSVPCPLEGT